jgi:hypothetical protein
LSCFSLRAFCSASSHMVGGCSYVFR